MIKRLFYIALTLLIPVSAWAWMNVVQLGGGVAASGGGTVDNCPDATYDFAYTGDNTQGASYACFSDGTVSANVATESGMTWSSGYGMLNSAGDKACWTVNIASTTVGTLWVSFYQVVSVTSRGVLVGIDDGSDSVYITIESNAETHRGYNFADIVTDATTFATSGSWVTSGLTWENDGTDRHKLVVDSTNWTTGSEEPDVLDAASGNWTSICIGDNIGSGSPNRELRVTDIYFISGTYEESHP